MRDLEKVVYEEKIVCKEKVVYEEKIVYEERVEVHRCGGCYCPPCEQCRVAGCLKYL